jgi:hypothetical protein
MPGATGARDDRIGIHQRVVPARGLGREPGLDERLVEPRGNSFAEQGREHVERDEVRMEGARAHVRDLDDADGSGPAHDHAALALLSRLLRDDLGNRMLRPRETTELLVEEAQRLRGVEVAHQDGFGIVRPEERLVVLAEARRGHALQIGAVPDGRPVVRVRGDGRGDHGLVEGAVRIVLPDLEFVHDHGHLRLALVVEEKRAPHAIRFDLHGERQPVRGERGESGHAVVPRGHVGTGGLGPRFVEDVLEGPVSLRAAEILGALVEQQVFQEVGASRVSGRLVA